jgi:FkbM family methyltransferase
MSNKFKKWKKILKDKYITFNKLDKTYRIIGDLKQFSIILPFDHKLPDIQANYQLYDKKLPQLAKLIFEQKGGICVDIGANVGDTAAAIRANTLMPIVCIEGDAYFFDYLEKNTQSLPDITLVKAFVDKEDNVSHKKNQLSHGTGKIIEDVSGTSKMTFLSLSNIFNQYKIDNQSVTLLKVDTDGFDFGILLGSAAFIKSFKPALYFEYEVNDAKAQQLSLELMTKLGEIGYQFIVYDNYGNFLSCVKSDFVQRFTELNAYIKSCRANGGGIAYLDVFATTDRLILEQVYQKECIVH